MMLDLSEIIDRGIQNFSANILPHGDDVIGNFDEIPSEDSDDEFGGKTVREAKRQAQQLQQRQDSALEKFGLLKLLNNREEKISTVKEPSAEDDVDLETVYCDLGRVRESSRLEEQVAQQALRKSSLKAGLVKQEAVPPLEVGQRRAIKERRAKREATRGEGWFNMAAGELTEETKNDLKLLKMRSALDPKHFYKKNDMKELPKYFQVGTVVESPTDFYSSRIPKKQRKRTMVEELLADAEFQQYNKRRYTEIVEERRKNSFHAHRRAIRLKRKQKDKKKKRVDATDV